MQPTVLRSPSFRKHRAVFVALLFAVGCSSSGSSCGQACGGAFTTTDANGKPFKFTGDRLQNVAQLRVTQTGFNFLTADHLNQLLGAVQGSIAVPCIDKPLTNVCNLPVLPDKLEVLLGDDQFLGSCTEPAGVPQPGTPVHLTFKSVNWSLNPSENTLHLQLVVHVKTGDIYIRTVESHSTICSGNNPIQAHAWYDDEDASLLPPGATPDTTLDLALQLSNAPDGRLEVNLSQDSLTNSLAGFTPSAIGFDGSAPSVAASATGTFYGNPCDGAAGGYPVVKADGSGNLTCSGIFDSATVNTIRGFLLDALKDVFVKQIVNVVRTQFDNARCMRAVDANGNVSGCKTDGQCGSDDSGTALTCDTARGVCTAAGQTGFDCEPVPLGISGQLDESRISDKVGFAPNAKLDLFVGLGSKTAQPTIDSSGVQLTAMAGTAPGSPFASACVPPAFPLADISPPPLNFDGPDKPVGVGAYDVAFSVASEMLNRGFYDAYNAGMLCVAISTKTTPFISSGLFTAFLPSLGLVTGGKTVPMAILLRPSAPPSVRIGRGTVDPTTGALIDPLITLTMKGLNFDFYALIDERMVRVFSMQADLALPFGLRTGTGAQANTLLPVLGSLDTLLTNLSASNNEMLAEDPGVVKNLLSAAVALAQPLIGSFLKPITLPSFAGLDVQVTGIAGAIQEGNPSDGYHHLAVWAGIAQAGAASASYSVRTQARIADTFVPSWEQTRGADGVFPQVVIEASAEQSRSARPPEFSYRLDGGLWSSWVSGPRITIANAIFLFEGHHLIEVIARDAGDDRTADPQPVSLDFLVSQQGGPPQANSALTE